MSNVVEKVKEWDSNEEDGESHWNGGSTSTEAILNDSGGSDKTTPNERKNFLQHLIDHKWDSLAIWKASISMADLKLFFVVFTLFDEHRLFPWVIETKEINWITSDCCT